MLRAPAIFLGLVMCAALTAQDRAKARQDCIAFISGFPEKGKGEPPRFPTSLDAAELVFFESGCYGNCPSYRMRIRNNSIEFEGFDYVRKKGKRKAKFSAEEFEKLIRAWYAARFYDMREDYCMPECPDGTVIVVTDIPSTSITLSTAEFMKEIRECYFLVDGKPITPKPPEEYFSLRKTLRQLAQKRGWL